MLELADRAIPVLGFLLGMTLVAELADRAGLFRAVAALLVRWTRGSVPVLWLGIVVAAILCTAFLSLDTTAVLLTPAVLAVAQRLRIDPRPFAYTCVWLANTASLFLPVSNLTNLLAISARSLSTRALLAEMWLPGSVTVLVTVALLALLFRRTLWRGGRAARAAGRGRHPLLGAAAAVVAGLAAAILLGADVTLAALGAAAALIIATAVLEPGRLRGLPVPWRLMLGVAALFVLVQLARGAVLDDALAGLAFGHDPLGLLGVAGGGAALANLINNLPAYLALEGIAEGSPLLGAALLVGVNAGALVTPWASLATLLWLGRCRAAGVRIHLGGFTARGALLVCLAVPAATLALGLGTPG
ncbi:SLC13 family permease [Rothia sp. AR01]|uniref:SLC13 family permease n=1 Tax=Rothia santali TaxID=2949643 RepID=A0A9X2KIR9_9MICC|nr:SLC13 family permease [Rothia santali]MCP3426325.1 SLC13 family permease [Rothia santali]